MIGGKLVGLAGVGLALWLTGLSVDAQTASPPDSLAGINITLPSGTFDVLSLTPADMPELKHLSDAQLEVFINALEATPQIPFSALPSRSAGSYFSLANPGFPPFPGDVNMLPVWKMNGFYVLNDLNTSNDATAMMVSSGSRVQAKVSGPPAPGGGGTNTVPQGVPYPPPNYGTNLWIANVNVSAGYLNGLASNTLANVLYEVRSSTNLVIPFANWQSEGFFSGPETTNCTPFSVWQNGRNPLFTKLLSWQDSSGTGIPDWWWLQFFGQVTNVNAYSSAANDGYSNLKKYDLGLNPTNYYNPNPPGNFFEAVDASGTNAFLYWTPAAGPVVNYVVQRIATNFGVAYYRQVGLLSSNATWVEDKGAVTNANPLNVVYNLWAVYPGGSTSATDSCKVAWFTGALPPNNGYAYADGSGTNFVVSWTSASPSATNYLLFRSTFYTNTLTRTNIQIATVGTNATSYTDTNAIKNDNSWNNLYEIEAVYPGGVTSSAAEANVNDQSAFLETGANTNGLIGPTNFYGYVDANGTNVYLNWSFETGAVTNYIVYGGYFDYDTYSYIYHKIARIGSTTNSLAVIGATDPNGDLYANFSLVAVFTNGTISQSVTWFSASAGPAPGSLDAYLDVSGTNVILAWTPPTQGAFSGYVINKSLDGGQTYSLITQLGTNVTSYTDAGGAVNVGYGGLSAVSYEVEATYPHGGLSLPVVATVSPNPPAPTGLTVLFDSTGTNVLISWTPDAGAVHYDLERGTYNPNTGTYTYTIIATNLSPGVTTSEDRGVAGNGYNNVYVLVADVGGGRLSAADFSYLVSSTSVYHGSGTSTNNLYVTANLIRNQAGRWQLMFSSIASNVQAVAFYWYAYYNFEGGAYPLSENGVDYTMDDYIPVSSITNGIYVLPDSLTTNWAGNNAFSKVAEVQAIGANGLRGDIFQAGFEAYDSPTFVDGRQYLKQNLLFELRAATISRRNNPLTDESYYLNPGFYSIGIPVDTNYVESSIFHWAIQENDWFETTPGYYSSYSNDQANQYIEMDDVWPVEANYQLHPPLNDPNYSGPTTFNWEQNLGADNIDSGFNFAFQGNLNTFPAPSVLGLSDPYWIRQFSLTGADPVTGLPTFGPDPTEMADVGAYTSADGTTLYLRNGVRNLFGLLFTTALVNPPSTTLAPGGSVAGANTTYFYSQTADPVLALQSFYFAPVNTPGTALSQDGPYFTPPQIYPIPALNGFASTNQTGVMVASVGNPIVIGGWAKYSLANGGAGKYAYLGQYFQSNAYIVTSGIVTTNITGVVSPYGDFFPTAPGMAALVTMTDYVSSVQGTGVVRVISLNVDANHDGTMDFTYGGPDFVSDAKPFRFWVNDNTDVGDDGGNFGVPGLIPPTADGWNYLNRNGYHVYNGINTEAFPIYSVHGRRDLVDFFPVYLNIGSLFASNALSAGISISDTNWQFVLSQADGVLRFTTTTLTPTNYMTFLRDTNESGLLSDALVTTITPGGVALTNTFISGIATNNGGILLVEAASATTQPMVLTIYHGTNVIAQTRLPLSISGVEQMFRSKNLLLYSSPVMPDRLTDASVPNEPDTIAKNFVFMHGYNVNPDEARGVAADMYKRMYWSGSHAKFWAVTWEGADSKVGSIFTPNYHTNVVNAFNTAPWLANFIASLTNSGPVVAAAHSLGNMLTLSAISDWNAPISQYFMMDAAVPLEAIDPTSTNVSFMTFSTWAGYSNRLFAAYWYQLFPTNDARSTLSWNNRLGNLRSVDVYNFYSSGEEVLRLTAGDPPLSTINIVATEVINSYSLISLWPKVPFGTYSWYWQEKGKGTCNEDWLIGSSHGGWEFSTYWVAQNGTPLSPAIMNGTTNTILQTQPMFDFNSTANILLENVDSELLGDVQGVNPSTYAQPNRNRILSDAIPAMSWVVGANPVPSFDNNHNKDMMTLKNGWSQDRVGGEAGMWHHSDFVQMAYTFTYQLFNQFVTTGNLK